MRARLYVTTQQRLCCSAVCCGHTYALASAGAAKCKGEHHRSRRVDPAHVLGIKPGEVVVIRNIGGRITPALLEQLGLLGRIGEVAGEIPGGGGEFYIIVLQHTDCGITRLAGNPAMLTHYFQIQPEELKAKAVTDPHAAVVVDVASLGRSRCVDLLRPVQRDRETRKLVHSPAWREVVSHFAR